jgi:hypothetical protein
MMTLLILAKIPGWVGKGETCLVDKTAQFPHFKSPVMLMLAKAPNQQPLLQSKCQLVNLS